MSEEHRKASGAVFHGGLLVLAVVVSSLLLPTVSWPTYLLVPLVAYAVVVLSLPRLRQTAPRLHVGRLTGLPLLAASALGVATTLVLAAYDMLVRPDVTQLAARLPASLFGSVVLAGLCFSVGNALLEELIFRGVLYQAVAGDWGEGTAVVATAALFGLGHLHGYPPGAVGTVLAGAYGLALGLLRWWTGGLGLATACHIGADATIFTLLAWNGAFEGR